MTYQLSTLETPAQDSADSNSAQWRRQGAEVAESIRCTMPHGHKRRAPNRRKQLRALVAKVAADPRQENAAWVLDHVRLIYSAEKETRDLSFGLHLFPAAIDAAGSEMPRVRLIAREYLDWAGDHFREAGLASFIDGFQE